LGIHRDDNSKIRFKESRERQYARDKKKRKFSVDAALPPNPLGTAEGKTPTLGTPERCEGGAGPEAEAPYVDTRRGRDPHLRQNGGLQSNGKKLEPAEGIHIFPITAERGDSPPAQTPPEINEYNTMSYA